MLAQTSMTEQPSCSLISNLDLRWTRHMFLPPSTVHHVLHKDILQYTPCQRSAWEEKQMWILVVLTHLLWHDQTLEELGKQLKSSLSHAIVQSYLTQKFGKLKPPDVYVSFLQRHRLLRAQQPADASHVRMRPRKQEPYPGWKVHTQLLSAAGAATLWTVRQRNTATGQLNL